VENLKAVKKGDKVKVEYTGKLEDGTVFDSSDKHDAPLEFIVGSGQLIKGFDDALVGMQIGEEKEIKLEPKDAYGEYNPNLIKEMPRDCFPQDKEIEAGMVFVMNLQDGRKALIRIAEVTEETITIDLNPPLAGKILLFKIKVVDISE
jgi:FKBP-type peptidyl-prolyl cis-trans isomerase 2